MLCTLVCRRHVVCTLLALGVLAGPRLAREAQAVTIPYGNFVGATVDYVGVEEIVDPGDGLFGAPTVAGDALDFNPQGFSASAQNGTSDINDSNLRFTIMAHQGKGISNVFLTEAGDTQLAGFGGDAFTSVRTNVFVDVLQVNGTTPVSVSLPPLAMTFTPSAGDYQLSTDGGGGPAYNTAWSGSLNIDLGPYLANAGVSGVATKVFVSLDNTLTAVSQNGTTSFIQRRTPTD